MIPLSNPINAGMIKNVFDGAEAESLYFDKL